MPPRLVRRILRVNHAGEHGAVAIYSAQLAHARRADALPLPPLGGRGSG